MLLNTALHQQYDLYRSSEHCMAQLSGIEAIDYFFACQLMASRLIHSQDKEAAEAHLESAQVTQVFHILLALSMHQRMGNSCLALSSIAGRTIWQSIDGELSEMDQSRGFTFGSLESLRTDLEAFLAQEKQRHDLVFQRDGKSLLFTARYWRYEEEIAGYFRTRQQEDLNAASLSMIGETVDEVWPSLFPNISNMQDSSIDWQALAVLNTMLSNTSIISGGAGTGKTYTAARVLVTWLVLQNKLNPYDSNIKFVAQPKVLLAAPTGKAAQRLEQSIDNELNCLEQHAHLRDVCTKLRAMNKAKTLHRLLGIGYQGINAKFNENSQLDCDLLLVDEVSMVDIAMMAKLIRAMPRHAKLVLLGDANQLPSVESGVVLRDLVSNLETSIVISHGYSKKHIDTLGKIAPWLKVEDLQRRQSDDDVYLHDHVSLLQQTRRAEGVVKEFGDLILKTNSDSKGTLAAIDDIFERHLFDEKNDSQVASTSKVLQFYSGSSAYRNAYELDSSIVTKIAANYKPLFFADSALEALKTLNTYRCLTPTNTGPFGTHSLNYQTEKALQSQNCPVDIGGIYQGLPIMVVQNDYRLGIYNGDMAIIWQDEKQRLMAWFANADLTQVRKLSMSSLPQYERVYAMTIHKTQGSEFDAVDLVLPNIFNDKLSRELLYTGVTRAKKRLSVIGNKELLINAIKNKGVRFSGLPDKLRS